MRDVTHGRLYQGVEKEGWEGWPNLHLFGGSSTLTGAARFKSSYVYPDDLAWRRWQVNSLLSSPECGVCGVARARNAGPSVMTSICPCTHPKGRIWLIGCWRCGFIMAKLKLASRSAGPWIFRMDGMAPLRRMPRPQAVPRPFRGATAAQVERAWEGAPRRVAEEGGAARVWTEPEIMATFTNTIHAPLPIHWDTITTNTEVTPPTPPTPAELGDQYQRFIEVLRQTQEPR